MVGSFVRLAAAALCCAGLAACSTPSGFYGGPSDEDRTASRPPQGSVLQCVPYARDHSNIQLYGDAYTWWDQAEGRYARSATPSEGAVMALYNYAGPERGHLAVVRSIIDERTIRVDHANWLDDGEIFVSDPVRDVSPDNDWSQVRVYNIRNRAWGGRIYPVQGFIGPGPDDGMALAAKSTPLRLAQQPVRPEPSAAPEAARHDDVADLLESDPAFENSGGQAADLDSDNEQ